MPPSGMGGSNRVIKAEVLVTEDFANRLKNLSDRCGLDIKYLGKMVLDLGYAQLGLMLADEEETKRIEKFLKAAGQALQ